MPDITMCKGEGCIVKRYCHRYTAKPSEYQAYFTKSPYESIRGLQKCGYFWPNEKYKIIEKNAGKSNGEIME